MGYGSIAHEAEGRMGYWLIGYEGERNNCFSKIQLVDQKSIETKHLSQVKAGSNYRIPVHYCILEAASFEERGISIHMQISGRVFCNLA